MAKSELRAYVVLQDDLEFYSVKVTRDRSGPASPSDPVVVTDEGMAVCSAVADAINHPERWEPSEAYEIADRVRSVYGG